MNITEFFGVDSAEIFEAKEQAHGYLTGCQLARRIHEQVISEFPNASKLFREGLLEAIREQV